MSQVILIVISNLPDVSRVVHHKQGVGASLCAHNQSLNTCVTIAEDALLIRCRIFELAVSMETNRSELILMAK